MDYIALDVHKRYTCLRMYDRMRARHGHGKAKMAVARHHRETPWGLKGRGVVTGMGVT